jgi:Tfp pilus assembly protein PilN
MPANFNLLPPQLRVSKRLGNILKTVRALNVIGVASFLIFVFVLVVLFVIKSARLSSAAKTLSNLEAEVKAQASSEQALILLKDRLAKVTEIKAIPSAADNIAPILPFLTLSPNVTVTELRIQPTTINLKLNIRTNSDLTLFLNSLKDSQAFKSVSVAEMTFDPSSGYALEVICLKK